MAVPTLQMPMLDIISVRALPFMLATFVDMNDMNLLKEVLQNHKIRQAIHCSTASISRRFLSYATVKEL
ncbi:hypothetical protein FCM35_KLT17042 [Carex littledalei]|uniref:Uncharacterized protein n=1 Tax=Carex littledalei TaxID=544730 RepID=A0A833VR29_9POAL|nr:hypothetical protein FCM35_KLT17042 [Carex littledalei]